MEHFAFLRGVGGYHIKTFLGYTNCLIQNSGFTTQEKTYTYTLVFFSNVGQDFELYWNELNFQQLVIFHFFSLQMFNIVLYSTNLDLQTL